MSLHVQEHIKTRLSNVKYLIIPSHLISKIRTWLQSSVNELYFIRMKEEQGWDHIRYEIFDYLKKDFVFKLAGKVDNNRFFPCDDSLEIIKNFDNILSQIFNEYVDLTFFDVVSGTYFLDSSGGFSKPNGNYIIKYTYGPLISNQTTIYNLGNIDFE